MRSMDQMPILAQNAPAKKKQNTNHKSKYQGVKDPLDKYIYSRNNQINFDAKLIDSLHENSTSITNIYPSNIFIRFKAKANYT